MLTVCLVAALGGCDDLESPRLRSGTSALDSNHYQGDLAMGLPSGTGPTCDAVLWWLGEICGKRKEGRSIIYVDALIHLCLRGRGFFERADDWERDQAELEEVYPTAGRQCECDAQHAFILETCGRELVPIPPDYRRRDPGYTPKPVPPARPAPPPPDSPAPAPGAEDELDELEKELRRALEREPDA